MSLPDKAAILQKARPNCAKFFMSLLAVHHDAARLLPEHGPGVVTIAPEGDQSLERGEGMCP
eukprot:2773193-Pyramimonas_sp.AAC.1